RVQPDGIHSGLADHELAATDHALGAIAPNDDLVVTVSGAVARARDQPTAAAHPVGRNAVAVTAQVECRGLDLPGDIEARGRHASGELDFLVAGNEVNLGSASPGHVTQRSLGLLHTGLSLDADLSRDAVDVRLEVLEDPAQALSVLAVVAHLDHLVNELAPQLLSVGGDFLG